VRIDSADDSLYCWILELHDFPKSLLKTDMEQLGIHSLMYALLGCADDSAELRFPATFPLAPPFMRILHPRCLPFQAGGGGNVTAGGSICHEILTVRRC
jgi:ubiquitin-conjugating enzyme E2 Q